MLLTQHKAILRLGVPIAIGQLGVIVIGFADTMMVGHYNTDSLAAASFVNSVFNLVTFMLLGYSYGLTPLVSSLFGQRRCTEAGATLRHALICNIAFAFVIMGVMGGLYFYLDRMGQPEGLLPLIRPYYITVLVSMFFVALFNALRQFTDGLTDTSIGMYALLTGNVLNIFGNWLLIYGIGPFPELGLLGAGLSTLFSRIVITGIMVCVILFRRKYAPYRQGWSQAGWALKPLRRINAHSLPIALQMGMETGAFTFSGVMAGWIGKVDLATFQVNITLGGLGFLLYYSFASGMSIRLATYFGLSDWDKVRATERAGRHILLTMCAISSLIFIFAGRQLIGLFTDDAAVVALAVSLIPYLVLYQVGDALQVCYANALRGTSQVMSMMQVAFISYIVVNIPLGYVLAFPCGMGIHGLYLAFSAGLMLAGTLFWWHFKRAFRRSSALV